MGCREGLRIAYKAITYLAVVSVEGLKLLDVVHTDVLWQRLSAHLGSGKLGQAVGCVCMMERICLEVGTLFSHTR